MLKIIVIIFDILKEAFDSFLLYLSIKNVDAKLPENVKDVYNEEEYNNWKKYDAENNRLTIISGMVDFIVFIAFLTFDLYAKIFYMLDVNSYLRYFWLIFIISILSTIISLPFSYYDTFVIEEKYGLNKSTKQTFFLDLIKTFFINLLLMYVVIVIIKFLYEKFGNVGGILIIITIVGISLLIAAGIMLLLKIFNKFKPLEDGELKEKLIALCDKYDIKVKKIVIRDASRRTTRANAFCTGIGKKKTISLDDNLVNNYTVDQIVAVFAHEFAHAKYKHSIKMLPLGIINVVVVLAIIILLFSFDGISVAFGFSELNYLIIFLVFGILSWPFGIINDYFTNSISRKHEYEADAFAAREGYGEELIASLKKLNKESLSDINPHPLIVKLEYSHPTLSERITAIKKIIGS